MSGPASPVRGSDPYTAQTAAALAASAAAAGNAASNARPPRGGDASPAPDSRRNGGAEASTPKPLSSYPIVELSDDDKDGLPVLSLTIALWQVVTDWRNDSPEANTAERVGKKFVAAIVYLITPLLAIIEAVFRAIVLILLSPGLFLLLKPKDERTDSDKLFLTIALAIGGAGALVNITAGTGLIAANYLNFTEEHMPNYKQISDKMCPCLK